MASIADIFMSAPPMRYTKDNLTHAEWKIVRKEVLKRVAPKTIWADEISDHISDRTRKFAIHNSRSFGVRIQWSIPVEYLDPFEAELDAIALGETEAGVILRDARVLAAAK